MHFKCSPLFFESAVKVRCLAKLLSLAWLLLHSLRSYMTTQIASVQEATVTCIEMTNFFQGQNLLLSEDISGM